MRGVQRRSHADPRKRVFKGHQRAFGSEERASTALGFQYALPDIAIVNNEAHEFCDPRQ